ncbi:hypothetical protein AAVH_04285 [Aphelenchoides avenae]|nr:hypothetical protein AAVH_04285 [Aphelenchus avenae]
MEHWEEYPTAFPFVEFSTSLRTIRQLDLYCTRNVYGTLPPSLLEYAVATRELRSCNISCDFQTTYAHVNTWISEFIEKHNASSDNARKLPIVTLIKPFDGPHQLPGQCERPAQTNVPAPANDFIDRFRDPRKYRKMPANLFVFKNQSGNRELRLYSFLIVQPMQWLNHPILPALQGQPHMYLNPQPPRPPMNRPFDVVYYIESD